MASAILAGFREHPAAQVTWFFLEPICIAYNNVFVLAALVNILSPYIYLHWSS